MLKQVAESRATSRYWGREAWDSDNRLTGCKQVTGSGSLKRYSVADGEVEAQPAPKSAKNTTAPDGDMQPERSAMISESQRRPPP